MDDIATEALRGVLETPVPVARACLHTCFDCDVRSGYCILLVGQCSAIGSFRVATKILNSSRITYSDRLTWRKRLRLVDCQSVAATTSFRTVSRARHVAAAGGRHGARVQLVSAIAL